MSFKEVNFFSAFLREQTLMDHISSIIGNGSAYLQLLAKPKGINSRSPYRRLALLLPTSISIKAPMITDSNMIGTKFLIRELIFIRYFKINRYLQDYLFLKDIFYRHKYVIYRTKHYSFVIIF